MGDWTIRLMMLAVFAGFAGWSATVAGKPAEVPTAMRKVAAMFGEAQALATETGAGGATLLFTAAAQGGANGVMVALVRSRPLPGLPATLVDRQTFLDVAASASNGGTVLAVPFALLVAPSGAVTAAAYGGGTLAAEPACGGLALTLARGTHAATHVLPCGGTW